MALTVVSSGDSIASKTRTLAAAALELGRPLVGDGDAVLIDLVELPADALLGRRSDPAVAGAVVAASSASVLVLATPIYRATFNGTLKAFLDRFPTDALAGTAVVLVATAGTPAHFLSLDTGGRSVVASLGGWTVPTVVYAVGTDFADGQPSEAILTALRTALEQGAVLTAGLRPPT